MEVSAQRWITVGQVRPAYVIIRNCGYPGGWLMAWKGRVDWNQPNEFVKWEHVMWAVVRRLEFAGLTMVQAVAEGLDFKVLVKRRPEGKRPRVKL